ncbi:MAG: biopolymer transporter ExbD [Planctomycetota bacterium]|nr:biopolymer transporter ExbD [Planctomycetota bacterium]
MKLRTPEQNVDEIDMTPMIDVVFQLIIFFMVASSFVEQAKVYKVSVPKAETPQTISTEEAYKVAVTADGNVAPSDARKPEDKFERLEELVERLKIYRQEQETKQKEAVVVIEGDKDAKYQRIIQVWNAVKNAGIRQVSFQVEPGASDEAAK